MNGRVLLVSLCLTLLFVTCTLGASSKVLRRPTLSKEQRALLLSSKSSSSSSSYSSSSPVQNTPTTTSTKSTTKALIEVTKALARSHSASEVLTLNLTNLLILIVLKAVIFGIGLFYFGGVSFKGGYSNHGHGGGSHGGGYSRSLKEKSSSFMTENELVLMLTFLLGSANNNYECMYRFACEHPKDAKSYLKASKMMVKGAKFAKKYINFDQQYENVVFGLEEALQFKAAGGDCSARYTCSDVPDL